MKLIFFFKSFKIKKKAQETNAQKSRKTDDCKFNLIGYKLMHKENIH